MKLGSYMSEPFTICRGIRQGSILSPMLFNLIMDPLLSEMRSKSLGIIINSLFLGAFAHADDLWTMASNIEDTSKQALFVNSFTRSRGLHLCLEKRTLLPPTLQLPVWRLTVWHLFHLKNQWSVWACGGTTLPQVMHVSKSRFRKLVLHFFPMVN